MLGWCFPSDCTWCFSKLFWDHSSIHSPWFQRGHDVSRKNMPGWWMGRLKSHLVVEPYPSEKWWSESQLGWWHFLWKNKKFVLNHQPVMVLNNKCGISSNHPFLDHPSIFILKNWWFNHPTWYWIILIIYRIILNHRFLKIEFQNSPIWTVRLFRIFFGIATPIIIPVRSSSSSMIHLSQDALWLETRFFFLPYCMIFTGYLIKLIACYHPWVRSGWRQSLVHIGTQCLTGLQLIWNNQPYTLWVWLLHDSMTICSYHARHLLTYWPITKCFDYPTAVWQLENSISSGWGDTETFQQVIGNDIWAIIPFP